MAAKTRATTAVAAAGKPFELLHYAYDADAASIGLHAATALGLPPSMVFKTLMVTFNDGSGGVAVLPSDRDLDLKALAAVAGHKAAAMMPVPQAERLSGYHKGGISPFGQKKRLPCFVDASAGALDFVVVNGGQRGLQIKMRPGDLIAALDATSAAIAGGPVKVRS